MCKIWYIWDIYDYRTIPKTVKEKEKNGRGKVITKMLNILILRI